MQRWQIAKAIVGCLLLFNTWLLSHRTQPWEGYERPVLSRGRRRPHPNAGKNGEELAKLSGPARRALAEKEFDDIGDSLHGATAERTADELVTHRKDWDFVGMGWGPDAVAAAGDRSVEGGWRGKSSAG